MRISGNTRGTMCKLLASWHRMENLHFVHTNLPGRYPPCSALVLATGCRNGLGRRFDAPLESWSWGFEGWGGPTSRANEQGASLGPHPLTSLLEAVALWIANGQDRRDAWARLVLLGLGVAPPSVRKLFHASKDGCKFRCTDVICAAAILHPTHSTRTSISVLTTLSNCCPSPPDSLFLRLQCKGGRHEAVTAALPIPSQLFRVQVLTACSNTAVRSLSLSCRPWPDFF